MNQDTLQSEEKYTKAHQRKRRWYKVVTSLACVVVFCTVYALILPAITMEKKTCGIEELTYSEVGQETANLTEKEQSQSNALISVPSASEEANEQLSSMASSLQDDSAYIQEFTLTGARIDFSEEIPVEEESSSEADSTDIIFVHNGDILAYQFHAVMDSFSGECFGEGRVRLEFVLPFSTEQASFDLSSMTWLDKSTGYEAELTQEVRTIDDQQILCQILTGYLHLSSQNPEGIIPGEFDEEVFVTLQNMDPGERMVLYIAAAMENNTWEGICNTHQLEEKLIISTGEYSVTVVSSEAEQQKIYEQFLSEIEYFEGLKSEELEEKRADAEDLMSRLKDAFQKGQLSEDQFNELYNRIYTLIYGEPDSIAEQADGSNWLLLRDSGWFEEYSEKTSDSSTSYALRSSTITTSSDLEDTDPGTADPGTAEQQPSAVQVVDPGGVNTSEDGSVSVSKTISGTDMENVFDITLQVQTSMNMSEIIREPDMAVVIVMDISNTMNSNFSGVTRYAAAMNAAESFLDQFAANNSLGISKVGYVAFNTDAHQIFNLQSCANVDQADALKSTMRTQTGTIINADGYNSAHTRFTNVEAGLAMAADMLNGVSNKNKFIIFLSDGFPTTYISSGYVGYDPYDSTGTRFYDHVLNKKCLYGTSYSDEAAIRARKKAATIKASGITIFSIGVDVAGQTIQKYITQSENANGFSVVDRTGTTYEIGDASSTEAYKNWLRNSIGSGYYYDSTDSEGLSSAYETIFEKIKETVEAGSIADWVAQDPMPTINESVKLVEFIGFYDKTPQLVFTDLTGNYTENGENTAAFENSTESIRWDLKQSGYQIVNSGSTATYIYTLVYRVRLENENGQFVEENSYQTNDTTKLQYRTIETVNGNLTVSESKTIEFPIPSVKGYLAELSFQKVDFEQRSLYGAEFTLRHDTRHCNVCRGDGETSVAIPDQICISDQNGDVKFKNIPSGHKYELIETKVPDGCSASGNTYNVEVSYDTLTVTVFDVNGKNLEWDEMIRNNIYYELPDSGGPGTALYTMGGLLLMIAAGLLLYIETKRRKKSANGS